MTLHLLNDVANDAESTQKIENYVIIATLKNETMGKLINRKPGLHLLISNYQARLRDRMLGSLGKPHDVNKRSQGLA